MLDFLAGVLVKIARAQPDIAFDIVKETLGDYDPRGIEVTSDDMPIDDASGTDTILATHTATLDLTDDDGDPEDSVAKIAHSTYPDGAEAMHVPREDIVLVRRGGATVCVETKP
jgi:hypothetical protein